MKQISEIISHFGHSDLTYEECLEKKVKAYNSSQGKLIGYDCKKCLNRGCIAEIKNGVEVMVKCECMKKREDLKRLQKSGISHSIKKKTFSTFVDNEPFQCQIKEKAAEFVKSYKGKWFFIGGQNGCGKTHICIAIAGQLLKFGESVNCMLWAEDSVTLKSNVNEPEYKTLISAYQKSDVLYIDDLFKKGATDADIRLAFQILDYRYRNSMCTVISSENMLNEIYRIDSAIGGRIAEKSVKIEVPRDINKDYRLK